MDYEEDDLYAPFKSIPQPALRNEVRDFSNDEFRRFYKENQQRENEEKTKSKLKNRISIEDLDDLDDTRRQVIQRRQPKSISGVSMETMETKVKRKIREVKTDVTIDSRSRDFSLYPNANNFEILLPRAFENVKQVKMKKIEFPNANAVINSSNNRIYWRNQEDIDDDILDNITQTYPVYSVELTKASYNASELETEITSKVEQVKRRGGTGDFHFFIVDLDIPTDIVEFISLTLTQLPVNPLNVTVGLGLIQVNSPGHGFTSGDTVYLVGARQLAGIPADTLNQSHIVTVINGDTFQFEVNIRAAETLQGGGNTVKSGIEAPFQLVFGEQNLVAPDISHPNVVAPNIGYLLENSSERVDTSIRRMDNFLQIQIKLTEPHGFNRTFDFISQTCIITGSGTTPSIDGTRQITNIIFDALTPSDTLLININTAIDFLTLNQGTLVFNGRTYNIERIENYPIKTVFVDTFTTHNFTLDNINTNIIFSNTTTTPSFDGLQIINTVLSPTRFVIIGSVVANGNVNVTNPGDAGSVPLNNPLTTRLHTISNIQAGSVTTITSINHNLKVGDFIQLRNVESVPPLIPPNTNAEVYIVNTILNNNTFTIDKTTTTVTNSGNSTFGTGIFNINFPFHGFNTIISITNNVIPGFVDIQTTLDHNLTTGDTIRIMQTNSIPEIDGGNYPVTVISTDTFSIPFLPALNSPGTSGIIGMNHDFFIYSSTNVGGIRQEVINQLKHTVREVIDENNFTFVVNGEFSTSSETGGGNIFFSSLFHGFNGDQTNLKNNVVSRGINLEGENYVFIVIPQLETMLNSGNVRNIFGRITLDVQPGLMVFDVTSNPKDFDLSPLRSLEKLQISIKYHDGTFYDFLELDYSFLLEITELNDTVEGMALSSQRGITFDGVN